MSELHDDLIARAVRRAADGVAPITLAEVTARGRIPDPVDDDESTTNGAAPQGPSTGGPVMVIDLERERAAGTTGTAPAPRRRWPAMAAAAALLVVAAAVGWAVANRDEPVDVAPVETPSAADPLERATRAVDEFIGVYNSGDPAAVADWFADLPNPLDLTKHVDPAYQWADDRWTRIGPCRIQDPSVVCPIRREDDFHGAAGLSLEDDYAFRFDDEGLLVRLVLLEGDPWAEHHAFRADFRAWAEAQHPGAVGSWFPPPGSYSAELADMPTAEGMPAALELLDEFIAQSDRWGP